MAPSSMCALRAAGWGASGKGALDPRHALAFGSAANLRAMTSQRKSFRYPRPALMDSLSRINFQGTKTRYQQSCAVLFHQFAVLEFLQVARYCLAGYADALADFFVCE